MTNQNRLFDDLSKLMTNAMGVAQGARTEAEVAFKGWVDRWLAERDFVTREEFEAVREMAVKARTEASELRARIDQLERSGGAPASPVPEAGAATEPAAKPVSEAEAPASKAMGKRGASPSTSTPD